MDDSVRCYALRRINPFLGVNQVIETDLARAISVNGVVWDIEVGVEVNDAGWGSLNADSSRLAYYRFGLWSKEEGLVSRPLSPQFQNDALQESADQMIALIEKHLDQLPFRLLDNHELWLLDEQGETVLALLASARAGQAKPRPEPRKWQACAAGRGVRSQFRFPEADLLEADISQRAGFNLQRRWFERHADGSGTCLRTDERFAASRFPVFMVTEDWAEQEQRQRIHDFINWTAPALLTLQHLQNTQRQLLEQHLHVQACSIEHHWHLYPEVMDSACINTARVQCRLENAVHGER